MVTCIAVRLHQVNTKDLSDPYTCPWVMHIFGTLELTSNNARFLADPI